MGKKKPPSGRSSGRKPSGRQSASGRKGGRSSRPPEKPDPEAADAVEPQEEEKGRGRKKGRGSREKAAPAARGAGSPSGRETAEMREFFKPEGTPLVIKFAGLISGFMFVIMVIFSAVIYAVALSNLRSEMEDNGALLLKSVEVIADAYFEDIEVQKRLIQSAGAAPPAAPVPTDPASADEGDEGEEDPDSPFGNRPNHDEDEQKARDQAFQLAVNAIRNRYTGYLDDLLRLKNEDGTRERSTKILNAIIKASERGRTLDPAGGSKLRPRSTEPYVIAGLRTPITITRGSFEADTGGGRVEMVMFGKNLSQGRGEVFVVLSAEKIAATQKSLLINVILATLISVLLGVGVSFVLASLVSQPVNRLIEDITMVSRGKLEHRTVPTTKDEIGVLARTFDAMTQNLRVARDRELENQAREHDLKIATEIQAGLLPSKIPGIKGYDLDAYYRPSKEVGGDYYDFIQIDETHMGIVVADVSGKGIPGSMVMTMARSLLRMEASRNLSTADTLKKVNKVVARDIRRGMFVTALYLILDIPKRRILVSSAGHNPLVVFRAASQKIDLINPNGIALGFDKGPIFDRTIKEDEIELQAGDRVVMYTDGVVEAMNAKHEEYSDERFYAVCQKVGDRNSNQFINILVQDLTRHQGNADQHDDITVSTFRLV